MLNTMPPLTSPERSVQEPIGPNIPPRKRYSPVHGSDDSGTSDEQPGTPLFRTYGKGFAQLRKYLSEEYSESTTLDQHRLKIEAKCEVNRSGPLPNFKSLLMISGNQIDAQAATVESYLHEHFSTGQFLLNALQLLWESGESLAIDDPSSGIHQFSLQFQTLRRDGVKMIVLGQQEVLLELSTALCWFCCALRQAPKEPDHDIHLSNFQFNLEVRSFQHSLIFRIEIDPIWESPISGGICWHSLFNRTTIVFGAPIADRAGKLIESSKSKPLYCSSITDSPIFVDHPLPRGLEVPFDVMVELAAVTMPFEYPAGLFLTGFKTLLMATAVWTTTGGKGIQWHFIASEERIDFSRYIENAACDFRGTAPAFEDAAASRAFIGWADSYDLQLSRLNSDNVRTADLARAGDYLKFKGITASAAFGKSPATGSIGFNFEWVNSLQRHDGKALFREIVVDSSTCPVLLYCQTEQRGWIVPKLPVIEMMAFLHIKKYGVSDDRSNDRNMGGVKHLLQTHLKHPALLALLNHDQHDNAHIVRELVVVMNDMLVFAECSVRSQMRFSPLRLVREVIYGMC